MGVKTRNLSNTAGIDIEWQGVQTGNFTAVAGRGYFVNTTNNTITVTLPGSPSQGDTVVLKDYARTWGTNAVSTASALVDGATNTQTFSTSGQTITLVYMDGTKGWSLINEDTTTDLATSFISATGGTVTTSGDYKIHTFTGDGCFVVSQAGAGAGPSVVDYLVVAGGGGGAGGVWHYAGGGGGGAGGYRESSGAASGCYSVSPLGACVSALPVSATTYPVTVGSGGSGVTGPTGNPGTSGSNSVFSTITSTGGGGGGAAGPAAPPSTAGLPGGSGGGGGGKGGTPAPSFPGGSGNTPPVAPPQGNNGGYGDGISSNSGGGGGGATSAGANATPSASSFPFPGGSGATTSISASPTTYSEGGPGSECAAQTVGGANTGDGGSGNRFAPPGCSPYVTGSNGGSGIVIIRYKYQ